MRRLVLISGAALLATAATYLILTGAVTVFTIPVAVIVIIIGLKLAPPPRVTGGQVTGSGPLIVDRAVLGASIYQIFFFDTRLILKRLATAKTTIFSVVLLAIAGFLLGDRLIGALAGVAAGYAMQEYTVQSSRVKPPVSDSTIKVGSNDVVVPYDDLEKVQLDGNRLVLSSKRGITRLGLSRGYGRVMAPTLMTIFQKKFADDGSIHPSDTSRKQDN